MKRSSIFRLGIGLFSAALLLASGSAAAQVTSPGNNKPLPAGAQKSPAHQQGSVDLAALEERVRRLEGNLTEAEVQGGYTFLTYQTELGESPAGNTSHLQHAVAAGTLQLNADRTAAFTLRELSFSSGWTFPATRAERDRTESAVGSWTYVGNVLTLTIGGEAIPFVGGVGGRLYLNVGANGADGTTTLVILVKNL